MKKRKLLIALSVVLIATVAISCATYTCPTYAKTEKPKEPCLGI